MCTRSAAARKGIANLATAERRRDGRSNMNELATSMLGSTGIDVSRLGYGSMELRHTGTPDRPGLDRATAGALLNEVLDAGITYIDTSPTYGPAEELIGEFLSTRRDEFTLATKTGFVIEELPARRHVFSRDVVRAGLEWSLRRLRTDYVDLVQLPGSPTPEELRELGTLEELQALRAEGKCRFFGISGWLPNLSEHIDWAAFDVFQIPYSALEQENASLLPNASSAGIGTVIRGGVAQGAVITSADGSAEERVAAQQAAWASANLDELLGGNSRGEFMIRYLLSNPNINTAIVGTSSIDHLHANVTAALKGPLPPEVYAAAQEGLAE
jgi:aryl-alcohol dehydrogenase-like predicted oxidoreductase